MATMVGKDKDLVKLLSDLIELDYDAIEAYNAAIERLDDTTDKEQLRRFLDDHERHVSELTVLVRGMGADAPQKGDIKAILTKGRVVIGGLMGDKSILQAMKSNEDDTNLAYERAAARNDLTADLRKVIEKNLGDERRHRAWIVTRLEKKEAVAQQQQR